MVTSFLESRAESANASRASRARLLLISAVCARRFSRAPYSSMSWMAVLGPIPFTPGTLSLLSPINPR